MFHEVKKSSFFPKAAEARGKSDFSIDGLRGGYKDVAKPGLSRNRIILAGKKTFS